MNRWRSLILLGVLLVFLVTAAVPVAAASPLPPTIRAKFDPAFLRQVLQAEPSETFRFLVTARGEAELASLPAALSRDGRRAAVVERLQTAAAVGQARLTPTLQRLKDDGHVQSFRPFWVFNGLAVSGNRAALLELAARDDVLSIRPDRWRQWINSDELLNDSTIQAFNNSWGIAQIRADQVWSALEIDGAGVVVATVDTGADWLHPALQPAYRGWHEGTPIHTGNWYDATGAGAIYPVDSLGHGTHVMGLLVGQDGVGVAPGARWIAVRAFNSAGYGLDSWLHAAFEWLLAPAGNPALAPDIVNNSWSNPMGGNDEFQPDVQALVAAGILPVFATGNAGPGVGSIGAPASYPESLAVGASDPDDEVVTFSGRGPSPFGGVKPEIVAPGVNLRSALPGGAYGEMSGTSMAAPLVAGLAALLRQADPGLTMSQVTHAITSTAVPLGDSWPNTDTGWGRADALAAVAFLLHPGYLEGVVRGYGAGPLAGAMVRATEHGGGAAAATHTGPDGSWLLALSPGVYDLEAAAFGYAPVTTTGLAVFTETVTRQDFILSPLPGGVVIGEVTAAGSGTPLPAIVRVTGAPVTTTAEMSGTFALALPAGTYTLTAEYWGYKIGRATVNVTIGGVSQQDFTLDPSPTLLLVDSGAWYYGSEIGYFQTALDDGDYLYHNWRIKSPFQDIPTITDLLSYDAVIWSSPADSPGFLDAGEVISDYLRTGGDLFLSGQDVGFWDSGANGFMWSPYYGDMLKAKFLADNAQSLALSGTAGGPLEGLTLTLNGLESAGNQVSPDSVNLADPDYAESLLDYDGVGYGGVAAGFCLPYSSFYLSFGLEGVEGRTNRAEVMGRALDWFASPRQSVGVELAPAENQLIAPAGTTVTHTVRLRNTGQAGAGDSYTLTIAGANWPTTILTPSPTLSPCATIDVQARVDIPAGLGRDRADRVILTARSAVSPTLVATAALTTKTPAPILLVDDDLWYDQQAVYRDALEAAGFRYDYWDVRLHGWNRPGAPPISTLQLYPLVLWFTGYDWYSPITDQEAAGLEEYLAAGGRLFLSSQDALYYQADTSFSRHYLGALFHQEDVTPTVAFGAGGRLALPGLLALDYPFRNFSDGVIPTDDATVEFYSDSGWAMGLTNEGADWKTIFFSFPFESLPADSRPQVMDRIVGWLGWLGESEFEASKRVIPAGGALTFTATLRNDGPEPVAAVFSNSLPAALDLVSGTLAGGSYDGQTIRWEGTLPAGTEHIVRYVGIATGWTIASGTLTNTAVISYAEHDLAFHRQARVWADAPDLTPSVLAAEPAVVAPGWPVTYTLLIRNGGLAAAPAAGAAWTLPAEITVLSGTLQAAGGSAGLDGRVVNWSGNLAAGETITVSLIALTLPGPERGWLSSAAVLDDGVTEVLALGHALELRPALLYLPIVLCTNVMNSRNP